MRAKNPELTLARKAKRAGLEKDYYLTARSNAMRASARKYNWSPSELAMALADVQKNAQTVWGEA